MSQAAAANPFVGIRETIRTNYAEMVRRVYVAAYNSVLRVTLPNNPATAKKSGRTQGPPNQAAVKKLRERIKVQVLGKNGPRRARLFWKNHQLWRADTVNPDSALKLIVPIGKRPKGVKVVDAMDYIKQHSFVRAAGHKVAQRVVGADAPWAVTTAGSWQRAAKALSLRAGEMLSGWAAVEDRLGVQSLSKAIPANATVHRGGTVSISTNGDVLDFTARNTQCASVQAADYLIRYLEQRLQHEVEYFAALFLKYYLRSMQKHLRTTSNLRI